MAELIKRETGVEPELVEGGRGEFSVWVGERIVSKKGWVRFPSDQSMVSAVREALAG